ncbi:MAG: RDD family protein [Bdellovibrionaceae bacterium]|nr:RDD family protein [Pseudobdellovibrionaceae bacterium]
MVIGHDFPKAKELKNTESKEASPQGAFLAPALDRVAAAIVDLMVLLPIMKVFSSKLIITLKITYSFQMYIGFLSALFVLAWTAFVLYICYQATSIIIFKRTLGQYFFGIELKEHNTLKRPDAYILILRSLLSFGALCFAIPLFAILTDEKGRTFYDKITDTIMISTKPRGETLRTTMTFHRVLGSFLMFNFLLIIGAVSFFLSSNFYKFKTDLSSSEKLCEEVTNTYDKWWDSGVYESRLEVALALFSAFRVGTPCLDQEANFEIGLNNKNPLAYLAKGFVASQTNDALALEYFNKVCQVSPDSKPCELVLWINKWPNRYEGEKNFHMSENPFYLQIWSLKRDLAKGNMGKFSNDLEEFEVQSGVENFFAEMQMKSAGYLNRPEEYASVLKVLKGNNPSSSTFNERICSSLLAQGCMALQSQNCKSLNIPKSTNSHIKNTYYSCIGEKHNIYTSDITLKKFYEGFADDALVDLDVVKSILKNNSHSADVRLAALNKGFMQINSLDYLKEMLTDWQNMNYRDYVWRMWGEALLSKLSEHDDKTHSFMVFKSLNKEYNESMGLRDIKARDLTKVRGLDTSRFPAKTGGTKGE